MHPEPLPTPHAPTGSLPGVDALLGLVSAGDREAQDRLFALLYEILRQAARRQRARESDSLTWQTTEILHEAWQRLTGPVRVEDVDQFVRITVGAMRRALCDHARYRKAQKRRPPGDRLHLDLDALLGSFEELHGVGIEELEEALARLEDSSPNLAEVAHMRIYSTVATCELARELGVGKRTFEARWGAARAFLLRELGHPRP